MSDAQDHVSSEIAELGARAQQFEVHAKVIKAMIGRSDKSGEEYRALCAAVASLSLRAAEARFDAKQLAAVQAELTRAGQ